MLIEINVPILKAKNTWLSFIIQFINDGNSVILWIKRLNFRLT